MTDFMSKFFGKNNETKVKDTVLLGEKRVEIVKITPVKWKKLFTVVDNLPGTILQIITSPKSDLYMTLVQAFDFSLNEIVTVVSLLTDIDEDYINENVGLDELIEYVALTVEKNRLDTVVKNVKSLLPKRL